MTIIEAFKSGRKFKRKVMTRWLQVPPDDRFGPSPNGYSVEDILADDWEIEEEKIELTSRQIQKVLFNERFFLHHGSRTVEVLKALGFKE